MVDVWYFAKDGKTRGPFSSGQFKEEAIAGRLQPQDTVWKEGMERRVLAGKVKHLFSTAQLGALPAAPVDGPGPALVPVDTTDAPTASTPPNRQPISEQPADQRSGRSETSPQYQVRKRRVNSITGGILVSQNGEIMKYKKKCVKCGYEDTSLTTAQIPSGATRANFFCPKCKKNYPVQIHGVG